MGNAVKQPSSDLGLQIPDLLTERGLPDAELGRGACEVALLRDGQEIADMPQFHDHPQNIAELGAAYRGEVFGMRKLQGPRIIDPNSATSRLMRLSQ
jgi:hypothetical protein